MTKKNYHINVQSVTRPHHKIAFHPESQFVCYDVTTEVRIMDAAAH